MPLPGTATTLDAQTLQFKTTLVHPSLFAVAVKTVPGRPLPLRCSLFVTYPYLEPGAMVPGFDMEAYIGMTLPTVSTVRCWYLLSFSTVNSSGLSDSN